MGKEDWEKTWVQVYMWHCGDDYCSCTQPVVERITPNILAGFPWIKRERLWEGAFHSEADSEDRKQQEESLKEKAKEYGVTLDEFLYGIKESSNV